MPFRYTKRYVLALTFIVMAAILSLTTKEHKQGSVEKASISSFQEEVWNPLIAENVNSSRIHLVVDGKEVSFSESQPYMDKDLNLMIPSYSFQDALDCSVHVYNENRLVMERGDHRLEFDLESGAVFLDGEKVKKSPSMVKKHEEYYLPGEMVAYGLGYDFQWDIEKNAGEAAVKDGEEGILPYSYDLRKEGRSPQVRNQGALGTCWAFASLEALESVLLPEESLVFSQDHMTLQNSFHVDQNDGGEYTMAMAYLTAWQGPVLESSDPYNDGESKDDLDSVKHLQEVQIYAGKDYEKIKRAVFKYGGVESSFYTSLTSAYSQSIYYNEEKSAYCYQGEESPNHDTVIIGWDDNYPKENFDVEVEGDGAFICQNSWGEGFGENGVFYISYYDSNIGIFGEVYSKIEPTDNYDRIYQSDLCGWVGQIGFGSPTIYASNVFTAKTGESLEGVGFYATGVDTEYEIYQVADFRNEDSFKDMKFIKKGTISEMGYYTIPIENEISYQAGETFAIVVKLVVPNEVHPMAIEYQADEMTELVDLSDGKGYISSDGVVWEDAETVHGCNVCLKAYTDVVE